MMVLKSLFSHSLCAAILYLIAISWPVKASHNLTKRSTSVILPSGEKCYQDLGCFRLDGDFFHRLHRPFNVYPADREELNIGYLLYTRKNPDKPHKLIINDLKSLNNSHFNPQRPTKFIVHGFIDNQWVGKWMKDMTREFLIFGDYNVIVVDWSKGTGFPYSQSTANTRVVGAEIALLIKMLQKEVGLKPSLVHIIGHSLGAHVAGYAGERTPGLGRITGLDPAGPLFNNMPPSVRLDPTDAQFVDVIHSDSGHLIPNFDFGIAHPVGHIDFFPNGGKRNPGCLKSRIISIFVDGFKEGLRRLTTCDHQRAVDFFIASINNGACVPLAVECSSYDLYLAGKCFDCGENGEKCAVMGHDAIESKKFIATQENVTRSLYLQTGEQFPFCSYTYHVAVHIDKDMGQVQNGDLKVTIYGKNRVTDRIKLVSPDTDAFYPGKIHTFLVTLPYDAGDVLATELTWEPSGKLVDKIPIISKLSRKDTTLYIKNIEVNPLFMPPEKDIPPTAFITKPKSKCFRSKALGVSSEGFALFQDPCNK